MGTSDHSFWLTGLPQIAQNHRAVWHAVLAISCIHARDYIPISSDSTQYRSNYHELALTHYGIAMKHLIAIASKPQVGALDQQILVVACMVFSCLCIMQADRRNSLSHMWMGVKLIRQWWLEDEPSQDVLPNGTIKTARRYFRNFDQSFGSSTQHEEEAVVKNLLQTSDPNSHDIEAQTIAKQFTFPQTSEDLSCREAQSYSRQPCSIIIHLWSLNSEIQLHVAFGSEEISWPIFASRLTEILHQGQRLLPEIIKSSNPTRTVAIFVSTSSSNYRPVPMDIPICCQETEKRHKAVTVIAKWPRPEGFFDNRVLGSMLERDKVFLRGNLVWNLEESPPDCTCKDTDLCDTVTVKDIRIDHARKRGIKAIMEVVGEAALVASDVLIHALTLAW